MSIRKINFFFSLLIVVCTLNACVDSDPALGVDFVPGNQLLKVDHYEFTVPVSTTRLDSIITSSTAVGAVGYMKNDPFGLFYAGSVFRILPVNLTHTYPATAVADSAFLTIPVASRKVTGAGDNVTQPLKCYKLNTGLNAGSYYYNNSLKQDHYDSTPIGEVSYTGGDTIVVRLTSAFAQELVKTKADTMSADSLFLQKFKGIYLAADTANAQSEVGGRISYFNFSDAILSVYYKNGVDDSTRYYYYYIDDYSPNFNVYTHNSAHLAGAVPSSKVYLEGLAGVKPSINFNDVKDTIRNLAERLGVDASKIAINKAELLVQLAYPGNDMNTYPAMTTMAYKQNDSVYTFVADTYQTYFDGNLNRSLQQYAFNLTYYTQGLYTKHAVDNTDEAQQLMIFPTGVTNDYYSTIVLDRTYYSFGVLKGPATMKLTYTLLK